MSSVVYVYKVRQQRKIALRVNLSRSILFGLNEAGLHKAGAALCNFGEDNWEYDESVEKLGRKIDKRLGRIIDIKKLLREGYEAQKAKLEQLKEKSICL